MPFKYPPVGFFFSVEFLDNPAYMEAGFLEAKGFSVEMEYESVNEGGENRFAHKLPKGIKYGSNLELRRGLILTNSGFGKWCRTHLGSGLNTVDSKQKIEVRNLIVHLLDAEKSVDAHGRAVEREPLMSWAFAQAYPVKWDISSLDAKKSEIVVESLSIAYAYFTVLI